MLDSYKQKITGDSAEALCRLMAYENESVLRRYMHEHNASRSEAEGAFKAWKQFMAVHVFRGDRNTASEAIDGVWHIFLLHTRSYVEFCDTYLRGFVHHEPQSDEESPRFYQVTRSYAEMMFGELDEKFWPRQNSQGARCISHGGKIEPRFN